MFIEIILSDFAVERMLSRMEHYAGNVWLVQEPSEDPISVGSLPFISLIEKEFNKDTKLGFVYGKGSGCAFIRKKTIEDTVSYSERKKLRIACCEDLLVIMKHIGFKIKQVDYFDLDFQNIRSIPKDHPMIAGLGVPYEAMQSDELNQYLNMQIKRGALDMLHGDYLRFGSK